MELGELELSGALQEVGVSLDERHGLDVLGSKNMALINSLHLRTALGHIRLPKTTRLLVKHGQYRFPSRKRVPSPLRTPTLTLKKDGQLYPVQINAKATVVNGKVVFGGW